MAESDDSLLREIDFLILAAEQSGDTRDSIRLMLASQRDINARIQRLGAEVNGLRADVHRQVAMSETFPTIDARLRNIEAKVAHSADFDSTARRLEAEWRHTKTLLVTLFIVGGAFTLLLLIAAFWLQMSLISR